MGSKKFTLFFVLLSGFAYAEQKKEVYTPLIIQMAKNLSAQKTVVSDKTGQEVVASSKTTPLERTFKIPFVSIKKYMDYFIKNKPYAPANSLKVLTAQGLFHIWESEAGVVCAPDPKRVTIGTEWEVNTLLKVNSQEPKQEIANVLRLLLYINQRGQISLQRLTHSVEIG